VQRNPPRVPGGKEGAPYGSKNALGHGAPLHNTSGERHGTYTMLAVFTGKRTLPRAERIRLHFIVDTLARDLGHSGFAEAPATLQMYLAVLGGQYLISRALYAEMVTALDKGEPVLPLYHERFRGLDRDLTENLRHLGFERVPKDITNLNPGPLQGLRSRYQTVKGETVPLAPESHEQPEGEPTPSDKQDNALQGASNALEPQAEGTPEPEKGEDRTLPPATDNGKGEQ